MIRHATWCSLVALAAIAGCSRQETVSCQADTRYTTARSAPPVQIPDDLSPPEEEDALRLPPDAGAVAQAAPGECLEAPPSFFGESRPFQRSADPDDEDEPAPLPDVRLELPPAEQSAEPAPADDDRVIDN